MKKLPTNFLQLHFKKKPVRGRGEITLDGEMYQLFFAIDAAKPISRIAKETRLPPETIGRILARLLDLDLVEVAEATDAAASKTSFMDVLENAYIRAVGPIGALLLDENLKKRLRPGSNLSYGEASELVMQLAKDIPDAEKKMLFKKTMLDHIATSNL